MIKNIIKKVFYNPRKFIKKHPNIQIAGSTVLLKSCVFRFDAEKSNPVTIGKNSMVGCNFIFESNAGEIIIGDNTFINGGTSLISRSKINIGSNVTIAWGCTIYDHNSHSLNYLERRKDIAAQIDAYNEGKIFTANKNWGTVKSSEITIEDDVWIGFDCVILKGVTIGEGAIVGAKSVVRNNVEPWTVVAGNPAVVIKRLKH